MTIGSGETVATADTTNELRHDFPGAIVWEADAWGLEFSFVSESSAELLGIPPEAWQRERGFLEKHVHPEDWGSVLAALYRVVAEGGMHTCQHRMLKRDGSTLWVQTAVQRSQRANGSPLLVGLSSDITTIKECEQSLREAEAHSRLLIENIRDYAVCMLAPDGTVSSWNAGAQRVKGYPANEIIGQSFAVFWPPAELARQTPARLLESAELDGRAQYYGQLLRKGGQLFWAAVSLSAVKDEHGELRGFSNIARDLTDQRTVEQALRDSEQHFRLLLDSVQDYGVFMLTVDGTVSSWNRGSQRLKGYRPDEILGAPLSRFFPEDEIERRTPERLLESAMLYGTARYDGRLVRKGRHTFWANLTLSAVEDEFGRLKGFSNVARDVTEQKKTEDALRASEERIRLLIDSVQDYGFFMLSAEGNIASWSRGAEHNKGYRAEEIMGAPLARFFPPDALERGIPERLVQQAATEGRAEYEGWSVRKGGARYWANLSFSAVTDRDGRLLGISVVGKDLTGRMREQRAQAFLAEAGTIVASSLEYQTTLDRVAHLATRELAEWCVVEIRERDDITPVAVAHHDLERERLLANAIHDLTPGQRSGRGVVDRVVETGTPELSPETIADSESICDALGIESPTLVRELIDRSYMCVPLTARDKTFGAMIFVAPARRRYSRDDLFLAEELARRAALGVDNARLYEQAQRARRSREDVLAVVSHDLRNPLNAIAMTASRLMGEAGAQFDRAGLAKAAAIIHRAAHRMTHMIRDLLDFSSIEAGRLRVELSDVDANELIRDGADMMRPIALEKGVGLTTELLSQQRTVRCDRERIVQVFSNLLGNAIKFTGEHGTVSVQARIEGERVVFSVTDTGPGIPQDSIPHIFERYWKAPTGSKESVGLGLAIAKGIVESHGGSIWVHSQVHQGTTVCFALPVTPAAGP
ncbi:MAG: sensor histidine kinase [Myxococcales bacterium]|nr:sensor histidine kinase [Myxococcales bacterium]